MASTQTYYHATSFPIDMTSKSRLAPAPPTPYRNISLSPPEAAESVTTSGASSALPSYSSVDYDASSAGGSSSIDLMDLLNEQMTGAFDPLPLDRGLATQAQTSGALNAKHRELLALQAEAQRRLASSRANFADGMKAAKEVKKDLEWTQKKVSHLKTKTERKYPVQYNTAKDRFPTPGDY